MILNTWSRFLMEQCFSDQLTCCVRKLTSHTGLSVVQSRRCSSARVLICCRKAEGWRQSGAWGAITFLNFPPFYASHMLWHCLKLQTCFWSCAIHLEVTQLSQAPSVQIVATSIPIDSAISPWLGSSIWCHLTQQALFQMI